MTNNLTNTELQAAIDCILQRDSRRFSPQKEHLDALLAEQIRRLNAKEILPKIERQPAVEEWEYVLAYKDDAAHLRRSAWSAGVTSHDDTIAEAFKMNSIKYSSTPYGAYRRRVDYCPVGEWHLLTSSPGVLPETVDEIN